MALTVYFINFYFISYNFIKCYVINSKLGYYASHLLVDKSANAFTSCVVWMVTSQSSGKGRQ